MKLNLLTAILIGIVLGIIIVFLDPVYGLILGFGILAGCLFRALYLLEEIHKRVSKGYVKPTRVQTAMEEYLRERDKNQTIVPKD